MMLLYKRINIYHTFRNYINNYAAASNNGRLNSAPVGCPDTYPSSLIVHSQVAITSSLWIVKQ